MIDDDDYKNDSHISTNSNINDNHLNNNSNSDNEQCLRPRQEAASVEELKEEE
eukprot:CAMPEP_0179949714 /NCGR_PEP_ID=MMETSP0983-20121128/22502_1 /TAXON_ID=483367 /ORGANISM="non described non described, Strain CCMP 2436" /LENGTH=52 /DNA_ID=CAMNT_0021859511 /DNA_START=601 /DNA_END=762 /DNA_ORIENTATION=+